MIQIYSPFNTDYEKNGNTVIFPSECIASCTLNGEWELQMTAPLDYDDRWKFVVENAVISVPTFMGENQLYRIYEKEKNDTEVTAYARPIFMDSADDVMLIDTRPTNVNGQQALNIMMDGTAYTGTSNITKASTAYYIRKNLIEAINGDMDQSFVNRWGGEILYRNHEVIVNDRVGGDYGVNILYGKNLEAIEERVSMEEVVTRIVPVSYNGYTLDGDTPWVDSQDIAKYPKIYTKVVEFEEIKLQQDCTGDEVGYPTLLDLRAALREACRKMFEAGCDKPNVTMTVNMVDLAQTEEYKDYTILETVSLGDTVHCAHYKLGIESDARVIRLDWDCINNCPAEIELGDYQPNFIDNLNSALDLSNRVGNLFDGDYIMADKVRGVLNAMNVQLQAQSGVASKLPVRALLFEDLDEESPTYGALSIGTQGLQISRTRTTDGRSWDWSTAMTGAGMLADVIVAGVISDKLGKNWWNLDKSEFVLGESTKVGDKTLGELLNMNTIGWKKDFPTAEWTYMGCTRTPEATDPTMGQYAVAVNPIMANAGIRSVAIGRDAIKNTGRYTFSVWLKSNFPFDLLLTFNEKKENVRVETSWKKYSISVDINSEYDITASYLAYIGTGNTFGADIEDWVEGAEGELNHETVRLYMYAPGVTKTYTAGEILDMLTDGGKQKGLYMLNGELYVSMSYLLGGGITLGGAANGNGTLTVKDAAGNVIGSITNEGFSLLKGIINVGNGNFTVDQDGNMESKSAKITGGTIQISARQEASDTGIPNIYITLEETGRKTGPSTTRTSMEAGRFSLLGGNYAAAYALDSMNIRKGEKVLLDANELGGVSTDYDFHAHNISATGSLSVQGQKSRIVEIDGEKRLMYAHENASPLFADAGQAVTDSEGNAVIYIDTGFSKTVEVDKYMVFIQAYGEDSLYINRKEQDFFEVSGSPDVPFSWYLMAPQKGFGHTRMEPYLEDTE